MKTKEIGQFEHLRFQQPNDSSIRLRFFVSDAVPTVLRFVNAFGLHSKQEETPLALISGETASKDVAGSGL